MAGADGDASKQPLFEPRLVEFLRDRPRLVNRGLREEFLEQLAENIRERRKPDTVAERAARSAMDSVSEATGGVVRNRVQDGLEKANQGPLEKL